MSSVIERPGGPSNPTHPPVAIGFHTRSSPRGAMSAPRWGWAMARGRSAPPGGGVASAVPSTRPSTSSRPSRGRSRSPTAAPSAQLRRDAPVRLPHTTGSFPDLSTSAAREAALSSFNLDIYAPSNRASVASRLRLCERLLDVWGMHMEPPTPKSVTALGASLKAGRYRSAAVYLSAYKAWALRHGHDWPAPLQQALQDAVRSCERGLGGPVKARALPFARLAELPGGDEPWSPGGPLRPRNAMVLGAWFLTREIELSAAAAASLELYFSPSGAPQVRFHLPASKSDIMAVGTAREHGCSCVGSPRPSCPAHAAWDQLSFLREKFPAQWQAAATMSLPLFPSSTGAACTKEAMTATIVRAAGFLGVELAAPDGSERVSGHSLRATGAQGLAAAGVDTWAIELLGRWGGEAVRGYIRDARLADASAMARRVAEAVPLEVLVRRILASQSGTAPGTASSAASPSANTAELLPAYGLGTWIPAVAADMAGAAGVAGLAEPLAAEVAVTSNLSASGECSGESFVLNSVTGVAHRVLVGFDDSPATTWLASCGWRFGLSIWRAPPVQIPRQELPRAPQLLCARCLPEVRRAAVLAIEAWNA